jgi:exopolysaccharide biosynthesis protein
VETSIGAEPTLYISRRNALTFNDPPNNIYTAISGGRMLVLKGEPVPALDNQSLEPQTAIGINRNGRFLYIVVADGRQPLYSNGITFAKLAELLTKQGAYVAMSLDGGGSSTMVIEGEDGQAVILNSPIDNYIPGRERPVGNHLGIYVERK